MSNIDIVYVLIGNSFIQSFVLVVITMIALDHFVVDTSVVHVNVLIVVNSFM